MTSPPTSRSIIPAIAGVLGAFSMLSACVPVGVFSCTDDSECGPQGVCEPNGYCSGVDDGCESGRRYSRYAPESVAGRCVVPDGDTDASTTGPRSACVPAGRDPAQPVLLYDFCEGEGTEVASITQNPFPLDFEKGAVGDGFVWVEDGLMLDGDWEDAHTGLRSREPVFDALDACRDGGEVTVEAWVTPLDESQGGPTGIVVFGPAPGVGDSLNFGIAMNPDWAVPGYVGVMRTDAELTLAWSQTPLLRANHLVLVHEPGLTSLYLDGEVIASMAQAGDLSDWSPNYDLMFGNYTYYDVRNWRGTFHLVAIYCEALDAARIGTNFEAGHRPL